MVFIRERAVTTSKPHQCEGCLERIETGTRVTYRISAVEGEFSAVYLCDPCHAFLHEHPEQVCDDDNFWHAGDIGEARREGQAEENSGRTSRWA